MINWVWVLWGLLILLGPATVFYAGYKIGFNDGGLCGGLCDCGHTNREICLIENCKCIRKVGVTYE